MIFEKDILKKIDFITEKELQEEILKNCEVLSFKKGDVIVREGQYVKILPIVISGHIRVFQTKEDREILLYYVEPSQTCMMSLSACFFNNQSPSQAIAMAQTEIIAIPSRFIIQWQKQYNSWNNFVIKTFRKRYDELLDTFESVAFDHIDKRVIEYLERRKLHQESSMVKISHQQLANELGTTRVVISRILKQFELNGKLILHRAEIELL
ncbi:CRP/FNR family transcriptional regulator [Aquimarina sp. MAR_2010_214]|uniref:Crp/Fnr family transcriptional regulator n=1 Tax=Aquimarina sp. MAR_2010_214 TaxID=1250026 RepID=UPI000C6FEE33|nr:Crp/Fnr family transcriptional regulator [Aquimarina sp. MAR_2010_214]PKV51855.1 CRP/FNR family transcriptional regulator [Aquimarina sp. MAR_2010_214]